MNSHIVTIFIAFFISSLLLGCDNKSTEVTDTHIVDPATVGVSVEQLNKIDTLVKKAVEDRVVPGTVVLIAKEGKVIYHKAFGNSNLDTAMTTDTIFLMYSSSKIVPAIAIMQLVEQGKVKLDDPITNYLPEFKDLKIKVKLPEGSHPEFKLVPVKNYPTIRHILAMTSGIVGYWDVDYLIEGVDIGDGDPDFDLAENVRRLSRVPLLFEPGSDYAYTLGIDVAGRIVEIASGLSYSEYLQTNIFQPLKMQDTFFYPPVEKIARTSVIYESDGNILTGKIKPHKYKNRKLFSAGVGIYSTTGNYFKLGQMLLNGGEYKGARILKQSSVDEIKRNQVGNLTGVKNFHFFQQGYEKYGLGCFIHGSDGFRDK
ncbi:MAG: beta-lactamase family protein, partial [Methylococcaceae bacterium]|nr:beta-lactamase family protein [Methylococcaceae bacterium]